MEFKTEQKLCGLLLAFADSVILCSSTPFLLSETVRGCFFKDLCITNEQVEILRKVGACSLALV